MSVIADNTREGRRPDECCDCTTTSAEWHQTRGHIDMGDRPELPLCSGVTRTETRGPPPHEIAQGPIWWRRRW